MRLKNIIIAALIFLLAAPALAGNYRYGYGYSVDYASGTVTQANMRISAVNGTAFVDFSAANILTKYLGQYVEITDSAGVKIGGWIKAAGTGETLGDELIATWVNASGNPYETFTANANGYDIDALVNSAGTGRADFGAKTAGILTKSVFVITFNSGTTLKLAHGSGAGNFSPGGTNVVLVAGSNTVYLTPTASFPVMGIISTGAVNVAATCTTKQVLTPSATGVTVVSTRGGTTYNWTSQEAGFNYNDTSGYKWTRRAAGP